MYGDTGPCNGPFLPPHPSRSQRRLPGFSIQCLPKTASTELLSDRGVWINNSNWHHLLRIELFHQVVQYEKVRDNSFLNTIRSPRLVSVNPTVCPRDWLVTIQSHGVNDIIFCRDLLCHTAPSIEPRSGCHPSTWIFATPRKEWSQGCTCHGMYRSTLDAHNQVLWGSTRVAELLCLSSLMCETHGLD